jgi:signal transduction histidine kinase/ActR/RegA family two-component response regulator
MSMTPRSAHKSAPAANYLNPVALTIQVGRNLVVQALGIGMVVLVGLNVVPWKFVLAWAVVAVVVIGAENHVLRVVAKAGRYSRLAGYGAAVLRILATTVYASAALVLIARGGPGDKLFACTLMSASMVHVLMRYYRSPVIMMTSISPYLLILGLVGFGLAKTSLQHGNVLGAVTASFTLLMFAVQFWSARAQLSDAWVELMTAHHAAEERQRAADCANRAKSQFLATMSHELRTPLNGVLGMAQALTADHLTTTQRERVAIIRRSSESLLAVLNDLVDLSKIEASALELEVGEFDLEHLVRGVVAAYRPLAEKKGLAFDFEVTAAASGRYLGDSPRVRRILYSLCDNAVKFTPAGGVTLQVDRDGDRVLFRVSDSGIGIGADDLAHLFDGFFQADAGLSRRYGGAGVGLAICRQLTSLMGGSIEAASEPGVGSTFTLALPLASVAAPTETAAAPAQPAPLSQLRILAAEDNPTNQLVLKTLLAQGGLEATLAADGREALAAWEDQTWDIILMDIQMPEMNGVDAARAIRMRELETGRPRTPIIAVTANAMTHQLAEYAAAGMDGVVPKPINIAALFTMIQQTLERADPGAAEAQRREA